MSAATRDPRYLTVLALAVLGAHCSRPEAGEAITFEPGRLTAAQACGGCHTDIYSFWQSSPHAASASNESFLAALGGVPDEATMRTCLRCHAPASQVTSEMDPRHPLNQEGVSCDICHSLVEVRLDRAEDPLTLDVGPVKYGPIRDAASDGHQVAYSALHSDALFCAGCHEYRDPAGLGILTTYSEWMEYQAAGGTRTCQDCHMPRVTANLVDPKLERRETALVNAHLMPGGTSVDQLSQAVQLELGEPEVRASGVTARVRLTNLGAGHRFPTGLPNRQVVLRLELRGRDGNSWSGERVYQRVLTDGNGKPALQAAEIFLAARGTGTETRLAPWESRIEEFVIPGAGDRAFELSASLEYRRTDSAPGSPGQVFLSVSRVYSPEQLH